jgi:hypothetical protein
MKGTTSSAVICILFLLLFTTFWGSTALAETKKLNSGDHYHGVNRERDVLNILSVLERKVEDQRLLDRVRVKLSGLQESQFSLILSLSKQILKEGDQAGADIAFLLLTSLIVLS